MKVNQLIKELSEYNPDADITVIAHNKSYDFSICYGFSEGRKKDNCESVDIYVDDLCVSELLNDM